MATVPRKTQPDIGQAGVSTVFQRGVSQDAFTAPARALEGLGTAVQAEAEVLFKQHARENEEAANRLARDLDAEITAEEFRDIYGDGTPERPGLYSLQGQAYLDEAPNVLERQRKRRESAQATLPNQIAQDVFADVSRPSVVRSTQYILERGQANRIAANEAAEAAQTREQMDAITFVWNEPQKRDVAITEFALKAFEDAKLRGLDDATATSAAEEAESRGHHAVITRMIAEGQAQAAGSYFEQNADRIDGRFHSDILNAIRIGASRQNIQLRDAAKEAINLLENGQRPANLEALKQAAASDPRLSATLQAAEEDANDLRDFKAQPLPDMEAEVRRGELRRTLDQDMDVRELRQHKKHLAIVKRTRKRIADGDGLGLAEELGVFGEEGLGRVDFNSADSLKQRVTQARVASEHFGVEIAPLTPGETKALGEHIAKGTPRNISDTLATLSEGLGETAPDVAGDLLKGKRPDLAVATIVAGEGASRREVAADIVAGGKTKAELGSKLELSPTQKREVVLGVFGGEDSTFGGDVLPMFAGLPEAGGAIEAYTAAADALYAHRRAATGDLTFDEDMYKQALSDVMGGPIDYEGRRTIPPVPGKDADWLEEQIGIMEDEDLFNFSPDLGTPITPDGDPLTAQHIRGGIDGFFGSSVGGSSPAQFVMVSPGEYLVYLPDDGQFAKTELLNGTIRAYTINLRDYTTGQPPTEKNQKIEKMSGLSESNPGPKWVERVRMLRRLNRGEQTVLPDGTVLMRLHDGMTGSISPGPDGKPRPDTELGLKMVKHPLRRARPDAQPIAEGDDSPEIRRFLRIPEPVEKAPANPGQITPGFNSGMTVPTTSSAQIAEDAVNALPSRLTKRQREILNRTGR